MNGQREHEFTITIEYEEFITRLDLDEILVSIDRMIEAEIFEYLDIELSILNRQYYPYPIPYWRRLEQDFTYLGIRAIHEGSITLVAFIGGAVFGYAAHRFGKGVDRSLLAEELERSGRLAGDLLAPLLKRINDWAERYVPKQRELGGRVTKITANQEPKKKGDD